MRLIIVFACFILSPIFALGQNDILTIKEREFVSKSPPLRFSNHINYHPYSFFSNDLAHGFMVDYVKVLGSKIGIQIEFITAEQATLKSQFENGHLDAMMPVLTGKVDNYEFLTDAVIPVNFSFITRKTENSIKTLEDMQGKILAVTDNWQRMEFVKKYYPQININTYKNSKDALEAVAFGLADASIEDFYVANYITSRHMLGNLHTINRSKCDRSSDDTLRIEFAQHAKEWVKIFNKAIASITEEEKYALHQKWSQYLLSTPPATVELTPQERQYLNAKEKVMMCIDPDWMPLEANKEGQHIGMSKDYMNLIEEKLGIPIEMVPTKTWLESIEKAKARECDIYSLAMPTPERRLYMEFTQPYLRVPLVLATGPDELFFSDISLIRDLPIGIVKGYAYGEILRVKYPQMQFVEVENVQDGLNRVHRKQLFGFIGTLATIGYAIQKDFTGQLKITGKFDEFWELGVGVRNDALHLFTAFEKAIASIDPEIHQQILNKWIAVHHEKETDNTLLFQVLGVAALVLIYFLIRQRELKKYNKKLEILSTTDALTGIYNRLKLDEILSYEWNYFNRYGRDYSIILMDVDDFKITNDTLGHKAGDKVLQRIAKIISENKRDSDVLGRWGGEEFLLLCKETDSKGATTVAKKIQNAINSCSFKELKPQTLSYGIAQFRQNDTLDLIFTRADKALYKAKTSGKNRIIDAEELDAKP
ncbi:transporter substrate-binding domain-containing protein [Sulfurospirillum sp. T05]|uniref:diguanylate cyclase n=1 Tax=Sulfurospirillum tamanense TaxID=2813362 RepID=A0ABS2WR62_9BACT|nr:transporter substrate-binding domain-containing protein [Sulfurospirillum tamanensis]MBN2964020.1 transporter substrate-binding domain-containing protein [Sulfurospirillum tamanensis]